MSELSRKHILDRPRIRALGHVCLQQITLNPYSYDNFTTSNISLRWIVLYLFTIAAYQACMVPWEMTHKWLANNECFIIPSATSGNLCISYSVREVLNPLRLSHYFEIHIRTCHEHMPLIWLHYMNFTITTQKEGIWEKYITNTSTAKMYLYPDKQNQCVPNIGGAINYVYT